MEAARPFFDSNQKQITYTGLYRLQLSVLYFVLEKQMKKAQLEGGQGNIIGKIRGAAVIWIVQNAKDDSNPHKKHVVHSTASVCFPVTIKIYASVAYNSTLFYLFACLLFIHFVLVYLTSCFPGS